MKYFYVYSEHVKANRYVPLSGDRIDEINFVVGAGPQVSTKMEDCEYEFGLYLEKLGGRRTMKLRLFDDSFKALIECKEVWEILVKYHTNDEAAEDILELVAKDLVRARWKRIKPEPRETLPAPDRCHACGRS